MAFTKPDVNTLWANTGEIIQPALAKINLGWVAEIPDYEFENWVQNRQDQFNAHINQYGIPVWDATTEYQINKSYVQGSDGKVYQALTTHTNSAPPSSNWVRAFDDFDTSYTKAEANSNYLAKTSNLSDLSSQGTARTNLSVYSKSEADARYLLESNNLSDLVNITTARTNLSVYSKLEGDGRYLLKTSNLSDLTNASSARTNLGLGTAAVQNVGTGASNVLQTSAADARYLLESNNLSDLVNTATARTNLDVYSKGEANSSFLNESSNLGDLVNITTARTNLSVYSKAESNANYASKSANLSDLQSSSTARSNLSVYSKGESDGRYLNEASNLSDLTNDSTARTNLGVYSKSESLGLFLRSNASLTWGSQQITGYLNGFDDPINYNVNEPYVMTGLNSYHSNYSEDRRWRIWYRSITL